VTSLVAVFEAAIWVISKYMTKSWLKTIKKYKNKINFYRNLHLTDRLEIEFTSRKSEVMPQRAMTAFTVCTHINTLLITSWSRSRTEYLLPMDNIIVVETSIWQRHLISLAALIRFNTIFLQFGNGLFLGHPVSM